MDSYRKIDLLSKRYSTANAQNQLAMFHIFELSNSLSRY